ncbi:hypothetical protein H2198_005164 [Neophaeococcomyces mojaviensis]|uniref:Uncharacterized protein n=1 Tax=Neophaeococcomyces mojaviensis TaxID=3383035 RepID=A0ACC3A6C4_9EURO|nr:hypothetical protein H2198_005164 [Knufia sp. JES_112]
MTTNSNGDSVPFTLTAAGHQGITTDASGSLLIKPCTQAEIDFYESAKSHPAFQAHMPLYMGSLTLNADPAIIAAATGKYINSGPRAQTALTPDTTLKPADNAKAADSLESDSEKKVWQPSGGAKLTSNLSIVLSNATSGFHKPNILDLKLGSRLWDDDAPHAKRAKLDDVTNTTTSGPLGFRVAGMKVYVGNHDNTDALREVNTTVENGYKTYDKWYGRSNIRTENVKNAFEAFLSSLDLPSELPIVATSSRVKRKLVLERLHQEVSELESVLEKEESRMYSASILMVYEGHPEALDEALIRHEAEAHKARTNQEIYEENEDEDGENEHGEEEEEEEEKHKIHEVVMIDFAHAHWAPGQGPDENVLKGVRNIKEILGELLKDIS